MSNQKISMTGAKLHKGQVNIVSDILSSDAMYYIICTPRQFGKSFMAIQLMLYFALNNKNSKLMFTSPVHSQSSRIFKELLKGVKDTEIVERFNRAENSVIFINGSELFFKSVQLPDNLRGYDLDYLFMDEAAMYKDEIFEEVLRPMLVVRGKKCFMFSTPKGRNFFYRFYMKGQDENQPRYKSYKGQNKDNPYANIDEIEDARRTLPSEIFKQEYEAEFIDGKGIVFSKINNAAVLQKWQDPSPNESYFGGLDIAISGDYLVLTILNSKNEIVYCYRDTRKTMSYMLRNIEIILNKYNPRYTYVETNGIGKGIYENIQRLHRSIDSFTTTNKTKQDIIEDLIFEFQEEKIKIPTKEFFPHYYNELEDFGFSYSPKSKKVIYGAVSGHDDCVMSLAIANHARKNGAARGVYHIV